jgi:hypothetical protein
LLGSEFIPHPKSTFLSTFRLPRASQGLSFESPAIFQVDCFRNRGIKNKIKSLMGEGGDGGKKIRQRKK